MPPYVASIASTDTGPGSSATNSRFTKPHSHCDSCIQPARPTAEPAISRSRPSNNPNTRGAYASARFEDRENSSSISPSETIEHGPNLETFRLQPFILQSKPPRTAKLDDADSLTERVARAQFATTVASGRRRRALSEPRGSRAHARPRTPPAGRRLTLTGGPQQTLSLGRPSSRAAPSPMYEFVDAQAIHPRAQSRDRTRLTHLRARC